MSIFSSIGKIASGVVKTVGKVASSAVKVVAKVASPVLKATPGVGQIYDAATALVGVDPVVALGNTVGGVIEGGNIGKNISDGLKESVTGGLVSVLFPSKVKPGEELPKTSTDSPGVYTYEDGSYAYTVNADQSVTYNPADLTAPPINAAETPNGSLVALPTTLGAKSQYVQTLLDSYGNPLGVDQANMTLSAVNNYVTGQEPLSGAQQSNLIALDVVNQDPEALAYTAEALAVPTKKKAVDWVALLSGLWNTAKAADIPGVSDALKKAEGQALTVVTGVVEETTAQKLARFIKDNMLLVIGGAVALILLVMFSLGRRTR